MYYRRANAALIVYDITREKSFDEAKDWVKGKLIGTVVLIDAELTVPPLSVCRTTE